MDITPYLGVLVTVIGAVVGIYAAISAKLAKTEARLDNIEHKRIVWVLMDYEYAGMKEAPKPTFMDMPDYPDSFSAAEEDLPF